MNPIKENQKIKIIPGNIENFSMGLITSVQQDYFVAEINNPAMLAPGLDLEILISAEDYMILFISKINKIENNNIFFAYPPKFKYIQKREYPRIKTNIPVLLKKADENNEEKAVIINIGGGGMKFISPVDWLSAKTSISCSQSLPSVLDKQSANINCVLNARFTLPNKKEINTLFDVLRVEKENKKFTFSGKFKTISNFDKTIIIQFCFKREIESKYKKQNGGNKSSNYQPK